jgi:riboflavin kinase/FMN adenylyltransferase
VEVFEGYRALLRPLASPAVALGNFDGVHLGHRRLLAETVELARAAGGDAVAFTFDPHPAKLLAPALAPPLITTPSRKLGLIAAAGIDVCVVEPFTPELAALPPAEFLNHIIVRTLGARHVVVGYDFTYGRNREGTVATLAEHGDRHGFEVHVVPPVAIDGLVASSTRVRDFAARGNLAGARLLLGRDLDVDGRVVRGAGRGRQIGVPTANVAVDTELLPKPGVYAVRATLLDEGGSVPLPGVANLGTRPTFDDEDARLQLEVHLLAPDLPDELYGRLMRVAFVDRIRSERRFDGIDALKAQIHADIDRARAILAPAGVTAR